MSENGGPAHQLTRCALMELVQLPFIAVLESRILSGSWGYFLNSLRCEIKLHGKSWTLRSLTLEFGVNCQLYCFMSYFSVVSYCYCDRKIENSSFSGGLAFFCVDSTVTAAG